MLEAEVAAAAWDESLSAEVDKFVRGKVLPEVARITEQKKELWERFFGEVVEAATKRRVWVPVVGVTLIPAVSYTELLLYSTCAAALGVMSELAPKLKELILEGRRLRRSSLFFLLNLR